MNNKMLEICQGSYAVCTVEGVNELKGYMFATWHGGKCFMHIRQSRSIIVSGGRIVFGSEEMSFPPVGSRLVAVIDVDDRERYVAVIWGSEREYIECLKWVRHNTVPMMEKTDSVKATVLSKPAPKVDIPAKSVVNQESKRHVNVPRRTPRIQSGKVVQFPKDTELGKAMEAESGQEKTAS